MNNLSFEFNKQLELDVLLNGLTDFTIEYIERVAYDNFDEVIIPEGIKHIGIYAFSGCSCLRNITIPNTVTTIDEAAFSSCWKLTNIVIPNSVTSIGSLAFSWCDSLISVTIPASVKTIGGSAFWNCNNLNNVTFEGKTLGEVRAMPGFPWGISLKKTSVQVIPDLL